MMQVNDAASIFGVEDSLKNVMLCLLLTLL